MDVEKRFLVINIPNSGHNLKEAEMLREMGYNVHIITSNITKGMRFILSQILISFKLIFHFRKTDYVYILFADYHAFAPIFLTKFFKTKSILLICGYDANCFKELGYGVCTNPFREKISNWCIKNADFVLPVAEELGDKVVKRVGKLNGKIFTYHNAFDELKWYKEEEKINQIITVAKFEDLTRIKIKGLDFYIEVARKMPDFTFLIVGATHQGRKIIVNPPDNLVLIDPLNQHQLRTVLSQSKVYCQFSLSEGMPNAVCEAMLCECVPVGTNVGNMQYIIKDCGYVIDNQNIKLAMDYIKKAFETFDSQSKMARNRILEEFLMKNKMDKLFKILTNE
jgi:glycosyltransferase involved in cell wall biosynthesis